MKTLLPNTTVAPGLTQNQFRGDRERLPAKLPVGSTYFCTDTFEMFGYGIDGTPKGIIPPGGSILRKLTAYNGIISAAENILSINADKSKFDVKSFKYRFIDRTDPENPIETIKTFPGEIGIAGTTLATKQTVYIFIDNKDKIIQSLVIQGGITLYTCILIGNLDPDPGALEFSSIAISPQVGYDLETTVEALLRRLGGTNLEGAVFSGNTDLTLTKTEGTAIGLGRGYNGNFNIPNIQTTDPDNVVGTKVGFIVRGFVNSAGIPITTLATDNTINPAQYNNDGVLSMVNASQFTILKLFYFYGSEVLLVYYGNAIYNSLDNAKAGISTELFIENQISFEATFRGFLIVKGDATDLTVTTDAEFVLPNRIRL